MPRQSHEGAGSRPTAAFPTLVRLTSSGGRLPEGEQLVLAAQVRTVSQERSRATGSIEFRAGRRLLGAVEVDDAGEAVLDGVLLPAGLHAITARYSGDAAHAAASSEPLPQAVTNASPVVLLVAAPAPVVDGVQLEAELVDQHTGRLVEDATGQLLFLVGSTTVASTDFSGGHARATVAELPAGTLRAVFPGDGEYAPATGTYSGSLTDPVLEPTAGA